MSALGIRTIIVGTDLTVALLPALEVAARLAQLAGAKLHVVHTTEKAIDESLLAEHLRSAGLDGDASIETRIMVGPPGALITQEAARLQADVIILGPHRPDRSGLGSTAYRVMHGTQVPCLVVPGTLTLPLHNVLVPLDISAPSRGALAVAITWASALRRRKAADATTLSALHVTSGEGAEDVDAAAAVRDEVRRVRRHFGEFTGVVIRSVHETGSPAATILERAQREHADMIVMGTRGQRPQDASLGSVSLEVVTHAETPVLLVPPGVWKHMDEDAAEQPRAYPDLIDDTLDDSFPASDPPSWTTPHGD